MVLEKLEEEDKIAILKMAREIIAKAHSVTFKRFCLGLKGNYAERFVGVSKEAVAKRQRKERFSFYSEVEAEFALYSFLYNMYNAKLIAKNVYIRVEDEKFTEQFDARIPLGHVMLPNGEWVESSVIEADIKVRNPEQRSNLHGMPFDIIGYRLVSPAA